MKKKKQPFKRGTPIVFEPCNLNSEYWLNMSEEDKLKYYGPLGYGQKVKKIFVFICEILDADGGPSGKRIWA